MQPSMTTNRTGGNPQLAAMFGQQAATQAGRGINPGGATLPQITQPVRPNIAMPAPAPRPVAQAAPAAPQFHPWSMVNIGGQMKPAAMTSLVQQMGRPSGGPSPEQVKAFANYRKEQIRNR